MTTLSTTDVSERLSVPVSTIKLWADRLRIGERNSQGQRRFSEGDLTMLELVRSLRDSDCGFETITRRIATTAVNEQQLADSGRQRELPAPTPTIDADVLAERITAAVSAAVRADNELAEKYAHAAHRIGTLEEQVRTLQEREARLLSEGSAEADRLKKEVEALRAELAVKKTKPWWRKILG